MVESKTNKPVKFQSGILKGREQRKRERERERERPGCKMEDNGEVDV